MISNLKIIDTNFTKVVFIMKKIFKYILAAGGVGICLKALDSRLETTYRTISSDRLPSEFDNFKIAHLSDYHNCPVANLTETVKSENPDIIAMTGDMTSDKACESFLPALNLIKELSKIAPCFIVSGNHDTWRNDYAEFVSECKKTGTHFLQNEQFEFSKNGKSIIISGMEDVFTKVRAKAKAEEYLRFFKKTEEYQILLFHRANLLDVVKDFGFDLILSGHLHGGQVRLPYIGGLFSPLSSMSECSSVLFPEYCSGLYEHKNTKMIISRGLGNPVSVPRVFNRSELGIITLKSVGKISIL